MTTLSVVSDPVSAADAKMDDLIETQRGLIEDVKAQAAEAGWDLDQVGLHMTMVPGPEDGTVVYRVEAVRGDGDEDPGGDEDPDAGAVDADVAEANREFPTDVTDRPDDAEGAEAAS